MNGVTNLWLTIRAWTDIILWCGIALLVVAAIINELFKNLKK